jgi:hypothetical protein
MLDTPETPQLIIQFATLCRWAKQGDRWAIQTLDKHEKSLVPVVVVYHPGMKCLVRAVVWDYQIKGGDAIET